MSRVVYADGALRSHHGACLSVPEANRHSLLCLPRVTRSTTATCPLLCLPDKVLAWILAWTSPQAACHFGQCNARCSTAVREHASTIWWALLPGPTAGWLLSERVTEDAFGEVPIQ